MAIDPNLQPATKGENNVDTTLNYYLDPSKGGITWYTPGSAMIYRRKFDEQPVTIRDMRGHEHEFDIHKNAFEFRKFHTEATKFTPEEIREVMYPEAAEFVKKVTGASRVHVWSHLVRRDTIESNIAELEAVEAKSNEKLPDTHGFGRIVPARFAHIDQSPNGARTVLFDNVPDAETASKQRWGIVNIWRPLKTIRRDPLCLCDSRSIEEGDLVPVLSKLPEKDDPNRGYYDTVSKGDGFETTEVKYNPNHKWWYASNMTPEEALVFKIFDSKKSAKGRSGHTAFTDPRTKNDVTRESMEIRSFVFYDEPADNSFYPEEAIKT